MATVAVHGIGNGHLQYRVWPLINGRRWGSGGVTGRAGKVTFSLPLPWVGAVKLNAQAVPLGSHHDTQWIWVGQPKSDQTVYVEHSFRVGRRIHDATLFVTCDDGGTITINDSTVLVKTDSLFNVARITVSKLIHPGINTIAVEAHNNTGPGGVLAMLQSGTGATARILTQTNQNWSGWKNKPKNWPDVKTDARSIVTVQANVGSGPWGATLVGWPAMSGPFYVGSRLTPGALTSKSIVLRTYSPMESPTFATEQHRLVVMDWEPWFTPLNARWDTAEAIPVIGQYASDNPDVIRQHLLWLHYIGINSIMVDWSNNLNGQPAFQLSPGVAQLVHSTDELFKTAAAMRRAGFHVPRIFFLLGVNGLPDNTTAENAQIHYLTSRYLKNVQYKKLYSCYLGRPLLVILNGSGPTYQKNQKQLDDSDFTVRWMWTQDQVVHYERLGYWSWMDGCLHPLVTKREGQAEAMTITPAFFAPDGWTLPGTYGRLNGWTYVTQWADAISAKPDVLLVNQWNEFAGQAVGAGYGTNHDRYVDTYNRELSDDIEPTSMQLPGIRSVGGWGYKYLNLTRAAVEIYTSRDTTSTLLAISRPNVSATEHSLSVNVAWIGKPPHLLTVYLDSHRLGTVAATSTITVPIRHLAPGAHELEVLAPGCICHFGISRMHEDLPHVTVAPASAHIRFVVSK